MLNGKFKGKDIGSGTDVWRFSEEVRAGEMTLQDFMAAESGMSRSAGVCMTMEQPPQWPRWWKRWA